MVYQRSKRRSSKSTGHELRIRAFEPLSNEEEKLRSSLEQEVKTAFYVAGLALIKLNEKRLYRNTHLNFDEFCQDVFGAVRFAGKRHAVARLGRIRPAQ